MSKSCWFLYRCDFPACFARRPERTRPPSVRLSPLMRCHAGSRPEVNRLGFDHFCTHSVLTLSTSYYLAANILFVIIIIIVIIIIAFFVTSPTILSVYPGIMLFSVSLAFCLSFFHKHTLNRPTHIHTRLFLRRLMLTMCPSDR